jgi:hypothetical protein
MDETACVQNLCGVEATYHCRDARLAGDNGSVSKQRAQVGVVLVVRLFAGWDERGAFCISFGVFYYLILLLSWRYT